MITITHHVAGGYTWGCRRDKPAPAPQNCPYSGLNRQLDILRLWVAQWGVIVELQAKGMRSNADLDARRTLGLSNVTNSRKAVRLKSWAMGNRAKRRVRGAVRCLEAMHEKSTLAFATLTLPPELAARFDAKTWQKAWKAFKDLLRRRLEAAGLPFDYVGVYEIHPNRSLENGFPILHLHLAFCARLPKCSWAVSTEEFTGLWRRACELACGDVDESVMWDASTNIVRIKKSVASYLGKYLSKKTSAQLADFSSVEYQPWLPRNWALVGANVLKVLSRNTVKLFGSAAADLVAWLYSVADGAGWKHDKTKIKDEKGFEHVVGGWIAAPGLPPIRLT